MDFALPCGGVRNAAVARGLFDSLVSHANAGPNAALHRKAILGHSGVLFAGDKRNSPLKATTRRTGTNKNRVSLDQ